MERFGAHIRPDPDTVEFTDALSYVVGYIELDTDPHALLNTARALAFALNHITDPAVVDRALEILDAEL